jgi:2-polyprenyl-6-methoxyphenol hydroxylase-like FAD-dependent oxidoreductase
MAGPAPALFLKWAGVESAVYKSRPFVEGVGNRIGLAADALNVLAALGLADRLKEKATAITRFAFRNARGAAPDSVRIDLPV